MKLSLFSTVFVLAVASAATLGSRDTASAADTLARCNEDCNRSENQCLGDETACRAMTEEIGHWERPYMAALHSRTLFLCLNS